MIQIICGIRPIGFKDCFLSLVKWSTISLLLPFLMPLRLLKHRIIGQPKQIVICSLEKLIEP